MKRRRTYRKRGTLHVIAWLMISSAAIRFTAGPGQAIAEDMAAEVAQSMSPASTPVVVEDHVEAGALLAALQARETAVTEREMQLADRMQALAVTEAEIMEQLDALTEAEESLRATIALADAAAETDLTRLATVYENMKPKDAAALFEEMSPAFAAGFLGLMRPDAAAMIMTLLEPQTAYSISVVLAGRNVGVPTD